MCRRAGQLHAASCYASAPVRLAKLSGPRVACRSGVTVRCKAEGDDAEEEIYLGDGKFIKDDPKKYANKVRSGPDAGSSHIA
eukprot:scaffold3795_cov334-Prasinococcus_capsulatus_cf.AAC.4